MRRKADELFPTTVRFGPRDAKVPMKGESLSRSSGCERPLHSCSESSAVEPGDAICAIWS